MEQILALKAENSNQKSLASVAKTADKSPSLAEGDLGGGSVKNTQNSQTDTSKIEQVYKKNLSLINFL